MGTSKIKIESRSIWINNEPVILMTSSLFYFRLPAAEWRDRMHTLKSLGYNAIDVYFPWNFHQLEPGKWDFSGEKSVQMFMQIAKEEGLWVIARPGPYICSEWDGGGLPSFLNLDKGMEIRQNTRAYLEAVRTWYDKILPILKPFQIDDGGPIIMLQIENELDFFDCADRVGLISALRDMVRERGIQLPIIACSGQGDLFGATGNVEGVIPVCNFYFESNESKIEERVRHYGMLLQEKGIPLCVTETNRAHADLRRLLSCGAKLIGPYLQTGGSNFGFTNSVNNWGDPLSFLASYHDYGGMVSPAGRVRKEGTEALILTNMITALGSSLALAVPKKDLPLTLSNLECNVLSLEGGGYLFGVPNTSPETIEVEAKFGSSTFPVNTKFHVFPNSCPFLLLDFPLIKFGVNGILRFSTGELIKKSIKSTKVELVFSYQDSIEILVDIVGMSIEDCDGFDFVEVAEGWRIWAKSVGKKRISFTCESGKTFVILAEEREKACDLTTSGLEAWKVKSLEATQPNLSEIHSSWSSVIIDPCGEEWLRNSKLCWDQNLWLEQNGIYKGFGFYRSQIPDVSQSKGLWINGGADILSIYIGKKYISTITPGGCGSIVPLDEGSYSGMEVFIRSEIWGHSNFDDQRLPALRLNSLRGMHDVSVITENMDISNHWFFSSSIESMNDLSPLEKSFLSFGSWSSTCEPLIGVYYKSFKIPSSGNKRILFFPDMEATSEIIIDQKHIGSVNRYNKSIDVTNYTKPGATSVIVIKTYQETRRPTGRIKLLLGYSFEKWEISGWQEETFEANFNNPGIVGKAVDFPLTVNAGEIQLLYTKIPSSQIWDWGRNLQFIGKGIKAMTWSGSKNFGRVWLPSENRPRISGGADNLVFIPGSWLKSGDGLVTILIEGVENKGVLESLSFVKDY